MNILGFGKQKLPSILKDPFATVHITRVYVSCSTFMGKWSANGCVEFTNGDTSGEQNFRGDTFDEVVLKIKSFLDDLNR